MHRTSVKVRAIPVATQFALTDTVPILGYGMSEVVSWIHDSLTYCF